jgi:hypothetical protein
MIRTLSLLVLALLLGVWGSPLTAQERESAGVIQTSLDALYIVDTANDSTTAYYSVTWLWETDAPARWVFPIPGDAISVETVDSDWFQYLSWGTNPYISPPYNESPCQLGYYGSNGGGFLTAPRYHPTQRNTLERWTNPDRVMEWLGQPPLSPSLRDDLQRYQGEGYTFVTLESQSTRSIPAVDSIVNANLLRSAAIKVVYPGVEVRLPIALRADQSTLYLSEYDYEQQGQMPVAVYILADVPYTVANYANLPLDLNQIKSGVNFLQENIRRLYTPSLWLEPQYYALFQAGLQAAKGQGFVTEFRLPSDRWSGPFGGDQVMVAVQSLQPPASLNRLTQFRTFLMAGQPLPDPVFSPQPDLPDFVMRVPDVVDQARFWGCSSRWLIDDALETRLPSGRTYIEPLRQYVAYPEEWIMTPLSETVYAFAPVAVDWDMVMNMEYGGDEPPMLLLEKFEIPYLASGDNQPDADCTGCPYATPKPIEFSWRPVNPAFNWFRRANDPTPQGIPMRNAISIYWPLWNGARGLADYDFTPVAQGVRAVMMSTVDDWAANGALYNDLLTYLTKYQFYTSGQLRHTLFLGSLNNLVELGYPEGWEETVENEDRYIHPESANQIGDGPYVFVPKETWGDDIEAQIQADYGIETITLNTPMPFETDTRRGYVFHIDGYVYWQGIIEISAPIDRYPEYADTLDLIAQSMRICDQCPETQ